MRVTSDASAYESTTSDENPEIKRKCLKEMVGAKGFEPSTSWSRTRRANNLSRCPGVTCGFLGRSQMDKFGQVFSRSNPSV